MRINLQQKRLLWWWCAPVRWKSTFSKRTLRSFLVEQVPPEVNGCSLLAKIELVCLHGSMVLMCLLWLTNHRTPIWDKWTIIDAVKPSYFKLILYTKQHDHYPTTQTLLCSSQHNKLRRNVSLINDVCVHAPSVAAAPSADASTFSHTTPNDYRQDSATMVWQPACQHRQTCFWRCTWSAAPAEDMIAKPLPPTLLVRPKGLYRATQQVSATHVLWESRPQHLHRGVRSYTLRV